MLNLNLFRYKIALLNVLRNRRRSLITLLSIQVGVVSLILFGGFVASIFEREGMQFEGGARHAKSESVSL